MYKKNLDSSFTQKNLIYSNASCKPKQSSMNFEIIEPKMFNKPYLLSIIIVSIGTFSHKNQDSVLLTINSLAWSNKTRKIYETDFEKKMKGLFGIQFWFFLSQQWTNKKYRKKNSVSWSSNFIQKTSHQMSW